MVERVDESLKADIMHWAAFYVSVSNVDRLIRWTHIVRRSQETRMRIGNKKIYHLEAWVVKVMSLYKVRLRIVSQYQRLRMLTDMAETALFL